MIAGFSTMQTTGERVANLGRLGRRVIPAVEEDEGFGSGFVFTHVEGHRLSVPSGRRKDARIRSEMSEMELLAIEMVGAFFRTRPGRMLDPVSLTYGQ